MLQQLSLDWLNQTLKSPGQLNITLFIWFTQELDYKAKYTAHTELKITEALCL